MLHKRARTDALADVFMNIPKGISFVYENHFVIFCPEKIFHIMFFLIIFHCASYVYAKYEEYV